MFGKKKFNEMRKHEFAKYRHHMRHIAHKQRAFAKHHPAKPPGAAPNRGVLARMLGFLGKMVIWIFILYVLYLAFTYFNCKSWHIWQAICK